MKTVLVAAAVLIDPDKRILLAQRPVGKAMAGLWEFPGGKVEPGESPEVALIRELQEELGIEACHSCLTPGPFASHTYSFEPPHDEPGCGCPTDNSNFVSAHTLGLKAEFHLLMPVFLCRRWKGAPHAKEGQVLAWKTLHQMRDMPMPPADIPLISTLMSII